MFGLLNVKCNVFLAIYTVEPVYSDTPRDQENVSLYRMSEYSGFILVSRNTLGP